MVRPVLPRAETIKMQSMEWLKASGYPHKDGGGAALVSLATRSAERHLDRRPRFSGAKNRDVEVSFLAFKFQMG